MDAFKYLNSRLGKTIEQIKRAYLSNKHICFIVCSEPEFIEELINSSSFFPNKKPNKTNFGASIQFVDNDDFIKSSLCKSSSNEAQETQEIEMPQLFIYNYRPHYFNDKLSEDVYIPIQSLINYVNQITSLSHSNFNLTLGQRKRLNCLKQSLILIPIKSKIQIPSYIEPYSEVIVVPFMERLEFEEFVSLYLEKTEQIEIISNIEGYKVVKNSNYLKRLYDNMRGLNATQVRTILQKNQMIFGNIYYEESDEKYEVKIDELTKNIRKEFERLIETSRALSLEESCEEEPAGLSNLTKWLEKYKGQVANPQDFRKYIIETPKGLLVSGIPGSGKSMMAKYIAGCFGLSLIRLDFGNLGGGLVGESEKNMDNALNLIEALSPCVLWVDEIEKAFSGATGNSGHETTKRMFGKFLTWMQEKGRKGISCFVFATANDISQMPPEMFRSGRFDDKYFTFMPTAIECANIFQSIVVKQTDKLKRIENKNLQAKPLFNVKKINGALFKELIESHELCLAGHPQALSERNVNRLNKFFTGADIDQLIKIAKNLYIMKYKDYKGDAVFDSAKFKECLEESIKEIKTYGETNLDDIAKCYAQLAINNFNNASSNCILPFKGYDELAYISAKSNEDIYLYDLNRVNNSEEKEYYNHLTSDYDRCLYIILRNTINLLSKEIVRRG